MKFKGKLSGINRDIITRKINITFDTNEDITAYIDDLRETDLSIEVKKHRKSRSLDANAMLWACLGEIAKVLRVDKWSVYLMMLKRYGEYTYILVKPNVVEAMKSQWRECEVVGETVINGKKAVQMLCYFGSSTYNSKEFSVLLDGVVSEMQELGLQPPPSGDMKRSIEALERKERRTNGKKERLS